MSEQGNPPTPKVKPAGGHGGGLVFLPRDHHSPNAEDHGEGNWLVSYADMMTLLVGFFVILLSFSSVDAKKFDEARRSITQEFGGTYQVPYAELADRIKEAAKKLGVGDQFLIKQSELGIEISSRGTVFFDTGSADMKPEARAVLSKLISVIQEELKDFDIAVEGHTDDVPIVRGGQFRNNWELSSIRACRVLEAFKGLGLPLVRLSAAGYGESRPIAPNRDESGTSIPENQTQNRRVVIKLLKHAEPSLLKQESAPPPPTPTDSTGEPAKEPTSEPASETEAEPEAGSAAAAPAVAPETH